jgi:hypothetical protein
VAQRFTDAAGAIKALTRKDLGLPEVTVLRPPSARATPGPGGVGLRAVARPPPRRPGGTGRAWRWTTATSRRRT